MNRIILYYSDGGNTQIVAETLAVNLRCDICRIRDLKKRDGFKSRLGATLDAFRENKTEIYPPSLDLSEYDTIYIGGPVWANNPAPAVITLIDSYDFRGKDIVVFTTSANSPSENTINKMELKLKARGARVVQQFDIKTKDKDLETIRKQTETIITLLDLELY